jgi:hypothetical protein
MTVLDEIALAFKDVPPPADVSLHVAEAHDSWDYDRDAELRKQDCATRWEDVPDAHIERCENALAHLNAEGLRFYLPAFMRWTLRNFRSTDRWIPDATIYTLRRNQKDPGLNRYFNERFSGFDDAQRRACALFLHYFITEDPDGRYVDVGEARHAMRLDWEQYLESKNK